MRVTTLFRLKKSSARSDGCCPIYLRVTLGGKRVELSTRIYVEPKSWDGSGQRMKGKSNEAKVINSRLGKIYSNVLDVFNCLEATKKEFDVYDLKKQLCGITEEHTILGMFDYYIATLNSKLGNGCALRTLMQYRTSRRRLAEFIHVIYRKDDVKLNFR